MTCLWMPSFEQGEMTHDDIQQCSTACEGRSRMFWQQETRIFYYTPCPSSHTRCGFRVRARIKSPRKVFSGARQAPLILESFFYLHAHVSMDTRDWHWMSSLITLCLKKFLSIFFIYAQPHGRTHVCMCLSVCTCVCASEYAYAYVEARRGWPPQSWGYRHVWDTWLLICMLGSEFRPSRLYRKCYFLLFRN